MSQTSFKYDYDNSGNLIQRSIQVFPNPTARFSKKENVSELKDSIPDLNVYPNPAFNDLNIEGSLPLESKDAEIVLLNSQGQILKKIKYGGNSTKIDVSSLQAGMYYLNIAYSKKERRGYKVIITK